ncbi:uncharacterized protein LOC132950711 isoform X3 [Metopolophium dirhodum]|uniref:uncharacterized protein LOC132950711 isoform X3 n=1 Tax=Metopolophium dirhodum TaxID=44670 RepID=UPI0029900033|nr:uncharacterized protein LOC132950711 isoform X3 [Metopolophium dirhodum]
MIVVFADLFRKPFPFGILFHETHKLLCIQQRDILNTKLKAKVASKAENDQDKFFEVRDYLERLVEGLVDGGLDDVCLTPLSTHPLYMSICWKYHEQLATTLTAAIHSIINESDEFDDIPIKLNTILKEVSYDVEHLPELQAAQKKCAVPLAEDLNEKNYEDLLATAILNKIVANSQTKKKVPVARTRISKFPPKQTDSNIQNSKKTEEPRKTPRVSLTVEEFTEEVTTTSYNTYSDIEGDYDDGYNEGDEEDDERSQSTIGMFMSNAKLLRGHTAPLPEFGSDAVEDGSSTIDPDDQGISATVDSWEDNWLFQKKRVNRMSGSNNYHHHPVPVPMLVPNPSEVTRPLIGDRDADETSELSDYSNSALDELLELSDFESEPLQTKRSDVDTNSANGGILLFEGPSSEEDNPLIWDPVVEACNKHVALSQVDSGQGSMDHQRDFDQSIEVNEKPVPRPRSSLMSSATDSSEVNSVSSEDVNVAQEDEQLPPRPGTIAEREHSKWEKATPLTNNPYSAENIEKRKYKTLFGSRSSSEASLNLINGNDTSSPLKIVCSPSLPDTQRYGRDYYINQSGELKTRQKQTKVSKLVVQIGEDELEGDGRRTDGVLQDSTPVTPQSTSSGDSLAPFGTGGGQDKLVRVCSWTDRRDSGSGVPKSSIAESADDVHHCMPSVRELAKQFSSHNAENTCKNPSRQVHSLTARSLSREYREGLGLKVRDKSGHAVQDSDDSGNGSAKSEDANTVSHRHLLQLA